MTTTAQAVDLQTDYGVSADVENQYLTFILNDEEYGVDILRVQEIRGWESVTSVPNAPEYLKGVINIRGTIVPIVDLRMRFGMDNLEYGPITVVIVLKVIGDNRERVMGIVVDTVSDTYDVPEDSIKPAPDFGDKIEVAFVKGLATVNEKMLILLDIDKLLNSGELNILD
ncbi:MAG: purine-binding chemotaxis protein CheW [Gammaproteobacteria bacterium]|nr:purine-binding chemotaxis protein CheW [Gammaproteobacteria bacterium]